jgi:hypothetical protein
MENDKNDFVDDIINIVKNFIERPNNNDIKSDLNNNYS